MHELLTALVAAWTESRLIGAMHFKNCEFLLKSGCVHGMRAKYKVRMNSAGDLRSGDRIRGKGTAHVPDFGDVPAVSGCPPNRAAWISDIADEKSATPVGPALDVGMDDVLRSLRNFDDAG